ncbi:YHYH protein [Devosia neptuniae]|jgi:hypothetical protein|uniref:YHYH protein n=1 Tax=Devosia TaxID=46913 RepID=UPI0022AF9DBD|nr:YHYH protein [Devosia neptuniae]MCZ4347077.1 YHYH protein [Devosia neptuniae]|tara:strand:+ start:50333 stop:51505 length:1173 start_codon:yes stop_codon:yes gene_type:complete
MQKTNRAIRTLLLAGAFTTPGIAAAHSDMASFNAAIFVEQPVTVECMLDNGAAASCHEFTVRYLPEGLEIGPFCPVTLDDVGGIWEWTGENGGLYRVDAAFLNMLDDLGYRFFDDDGTVHVVDIATEQPIVDHACINVSADETVTITMRLPVDPVMAETPTALGVVGKVGVALDGVPIFSDAPSIQQTGHMPALDTCGGHIDPGGWYHWHATSTDIDTVFEAEDVAAQCGLEQDSAALFGYAFDGFPMYGSAEADGFSPVALDDCNGHVGVTGLGETYHYHSSKEFPNLPACLVGVQAQDNFSTTASAGVGATQAGEGGRNEPPRLTDGGQGGAPAGLDAAAATLGITTEALMDALGDAQGGRPDLAAAAATLGITEGELSAALPAPPMQ